MAENTEKAITTEAVVVDVEKSEKQRKAQAGYSGNSHFDLVDIIIIKDSEFYKKGDTDKVHPATAEIFRAKGLIK